jgi:hypothetical protein
MPNGYIESDDPSGPPSGPPVTHVPTEDDYNTTVNNLIHNGWTSDGGDYDWGDGTRTRLFRQSANTEYKRIRKPNGNWELFSKRMGMNMRMNANNNNIPTGGRRRYKQKKSKKSKKGSRRRRTRRRK